MNDQGQTSAVMATARNNEPQTSNLQQVRHDNNVYDQDQCQNKTNLVGTPQETTRPRSRSLGDDTSIRNRNYIIESVQESLRQGL